MRLPAFVVLLLTAWIIVSMPGALAQQPDDVPLPPGFQVPEEHEAPIEEPPSGATSPAPVNYSLNALLDESGESRAVPEDQLRALVGADEIDGWTVSGGRAAIARGQGRDTDLADDLNVEEYASLFDGDASLTSSSFTLPFAGVSADDVARGLQPVVITFAAKFFETDSKEDSVHVYVLSGPDFKSEDEVFQLSCPCEQGWQEYVVDVSKWAGQTIQVKLVRGKGSIAAIGIDDVASNLAKVHMGMMSGAAFVGDPVNAATGNMTLDAVDLFIPGKGVNLEFHRYYNSGSALVGDLGLGWTHTYSWKVTELSGGNLRVLYPNGAEIVFIKSGSVWNAPAGVFDTAKKNANGTFQVTTKTQIVVNFSTTGRLTSLVDRNGNTTTVTYSGSNLNQVTDPSGRTLTFTVSSGRITQITDPLSRTISFAYTSTRLMDVTDVSGGITRYAYNVSATTFPMQSWKDQNGVTMFTNWNDITTGRVIWQLVGGGRTCFYYGADYKTSTSCPGVSPTPSSGQTVVVNGRGYKTTYSFNSNFMITQTKDHLNGIAQFAYDSARNTTCVTKQNGAKESFSYDTKGNVTQHIDENNTTSSCTLKTGGKKTNFTYTAKNDLATVTDPLGRVTENTNDAAGNLIQVRVRASATGATVLETCFTRNSAGLMLEQLEVTDLTKTCAQSPAGDRTIFEYNTHGYVTAITNPRFAGQPSPPKTTFTFDNGGRRLTATNELGHTTTWTYNARNAVLTKTDNLSNTTTLTYDARGNIKTATDALNNTTTYIYGIANRVTSIFTPSGGTVFTYDLNGNRLTVKNAQNKTSTFAYDALDRLSSLTDPLLRTGSIAYDAASRVTSTTDARGITLTNTYDNVGRQLTQKLGSTTLVAFAYDDAGNRLSMSDGTGITSYTYDALNRVTQVSAPNSRTVNYAYGPTGNRTSLSWTNGPSVTFGYDAAHNPTAVTAGGTTTEYTYNNAGNLTQITYPVSTGLSSEFTYDNAERLTSVVNKKGSTTISSFAYTLDDIGNRTQMVDLSGTSAFAYDAVGQLTSASYPGPSTDTYSYDAIGNRITKNATTYLYDDASQLTQAGSITYGYDNNGNQTSRGTDAFTWDHANRLTQAVVGSTSASYTYNGDGVRNSTTVGANTTRYTWDWASGLPVLLCDGTQSFVYGLGRIMATDLTGNPTNYYLYDGLGSVANVTDASGNPLVSYTYDAFGAIRTQSSPSSNYWGFAGEQRDDESGFTYLRARYYDPETGRFLSNDPIGGGYPYASNNPVNATDPSGLVTCSRAVEGSYTSWSSSGGSSGCYDSGGNVIYCEGTCPASIGINQTNFEAFMSGSAAPPCQCPSEEVVQDLNLRGAPLDKASAPLVVAVKESGNSGGSLTTSQPGSSGTAQITPPNTGGGYVPSCYESEEALHGLMTCEGWTLRDMLPHGFTDDCGAYVSCLKNLVCQGAVIGVVSHSVRAVASIRAGQPLQAAGSVGAAIGSTLIALGSC